MDTDRIADWHTGNGGAAKQGGRADEGSPSLSFSFGKFGWEKTIFKDSHAAAARVSCVSRVRYLTLVHR